MKFLVMQLRGCMKIKNFAIIISVALIISLFFNGYSYSALNNSKSQINDLKAQIKEHTLGFTDKANVYDTNFHDLLQEHTFLLISAARRSIDSSAAFNDSYKALQTNIQEVGAQISSIYGDEVGNQFVALWTSKIKNFISYTDAVKNNDLSANSVFASNMENYEEKSSTWWSTLNPNIDKSTIKQSITDHVNNVKEALDFWEAKDYPDYFSKQHDSYTQIGDYSDIIVTGIVKQHPELFE